METLAFNNDIKVFYVQATSFPAGVMEAFNKLHAVAPVGSSRKFFGLSRPENGDIVYRAAAEELQDGEAERFNCPTLVLKKGKYLCVTIANFMKDIAAIGNTFQQLIHQPGIDAEGYCVEWYFNDTDVHCMIRLADES